MTGGFAVADVEARVTLPAAAFDFAETRTRWGGTVGGGMETAFGGNWSAKLEYLYVALERSTYFDRAGPPPGVAIRENVPLPNHIIRGGVNYRFSRSCPVVASY